MKATIRSLNSKAFDSSILSITVPGDNGELEILPGHAKAFFVLKFGEIKVKRSSGHEKKIKIDDGICWVDKDVTVLFSPQLNSGNNRGV